MSILDAFERMTTYDRLHYRHDFPAKGKTQWAVRFSFDKDEAARFDNGDGYALPRVEILKRVDHRETVMQDGRKAPQYVQDFLVDTAFEIGKAEQARHGIRPLDRDAVKRWAGVADYNWSPADFRKAEELLRTIERPGVRREQARAIVAILIQDYVPRDEHEAALEAATETLAAEKDAEIEDLGEKLDKYECRRNEAAENVAAEFRGLMQQLEAPEPFEYAYGGTIAAKVQDLARDLDAAITVLENA